MKQIVIFCFIIFLSACNIWASDILIQKQDSAISIYTKNSALKEVLKKFSEITGITIQNTEAISESVSVNMEKKTIEKALALILTNYNYAVLYKKNTNGEIIPGSVQIIEKKKDDVNSKESLEKTANLDIKDDPLTKKVQIEDFKNIEVLRHQITAKSIQGEKKTTGSPDILNEHGIKIFELKSQSVFSKIGLVKGDTIRAVNETPVNSTDEFIKSFANNILAKGRVRIERISANNKIDPIYINAP